MWPERRLQRCRTVPGSGAVRTDKTYPKLSPSHNIPASFQQRTSLINVSKTPGAPVTTEPADEETLQDRVQFNT